jgi:hypothetical protein
MATKFSRYFLNLALAEIATKIDLLTRKYLNANARNVVKTLLGLSIENSDFNYRLLGYLGMTIKLTIITSVVCQGHSMLLDATFELAVAGASHYS